jgi:hypothetical protein
MFAVKRIFGIARLKEFEVTQRRAKIGENIWQLFWLAVMSVGLREKLQWNEVAMCATFLSMGFGAERSWRT